VEKFNEAVGGFTQADAVDFFLQADENGVGPRFALLDNGKPKLGVLPFIMKSRLRTGDGKSYAAERRPPFTSRPSQS
jgi:hypothetical protein